MLNNNKEKYIAQEPFEKIVISMLSGEKFVPRTVEAYPFYVSVADTTSGKKYT